VATPPTQILLRPLLASLILTGLVGAELQVPQLSTNPPDDIERMLASLSAERAAERWGAERWLAAHLTPEHLPVLAETALAGGREVQGRLVRALSSDPRHMGMNVLLLTDARKEIALLGQHALEELLLGWSASALETSASEGRWPAALDLGLRAYLLDPDRGGLDSALARVDRWGQGPMPLVLDPSLDPGVARDLKLQAPRAGSTGASQSPIHGSWNQGLTGILNHYGVAASVVGWRGTGESSTQGTHPFALIHKRRRTPIAASDHVLGWCRGVLKPHDRAWNVASARALAAVGWPAAMMWLEERWLAGDDAALEGLLLAARRGRVAPSLLDPDRLSKLFPKIHGLQVNELEDLRLLEDLACGVAGLPLPADHKARLTEALLEDPTALDSAARWARLVVWEGQRPTGEAVRDLCSHWFESETRPALRWQALRTLGALGGTLAGPPRSHSLLGSMQWAEAQGGLDLWIRDLIAVNAQPPEQHAEFQGTLARRLAYLQWCVGTSNGQRAEGVLARLLEEEDPIELALACRRWQGSGLFVELEALVRALALTLEPGQGPDLGPARRQFLLLTGLAGATERGAAWARWEARGPEASREQLQDLACLVADAPPVGGRARQALLDAAREGSAKVEDLGAATLVAGRILVWAGLGPEADILRDEVHRFVTRSGADLSGILFSRDWPTGSAPPLQRLWLRDRHFE